MSDNNLNDLTGGAQDDWDASALATSEIPEKDPSINAVAMLSNFRRKVLSDPEVDERGGFEIQLHAMLEAAEGIWRATLDEDDPQRVHFYQDEYEIDVLLDEDGTMVEARVIRNVLDSAELFSFLRTNL